MKLLKKSSAVLLAMLMLVSMLAFAGCNNNEEDGEVTYQFAVELPDGSPAANVGIIVCNGDQCDSPLYTNAEGKASVKKPAAEYTVHLIGVPAGYVCNDEFTTDLKGTLITFKCVAE